MMKHICAVVFCSIFTACGSSTAVVPYNKTPALTPRPAPISSYEASNTSLYTRTNGILAVGYADFNSDGREDLLMAYVSGTTETTPIKLFLQNPMGKLVEDDSLLPLPVPGTVHARKIVIADFNGDGMPDAFIADHGYDHPPFPGATPILLLSKDGKFEMKPLPDVPAGFQHSATAADINGDAISDIFVTDTTHGAFLLMNDGVGNFTVTRHGIPFIGAGYYTSELIDVDDDGYYDLLVGGHEHEGAVTRIYWGDASGTFSTSRATDVPGDVDYRIVLDFDAEDLDGDNVHELVLTRTKSAPFYQGYYFQILQLKNRQATDVSTRIVSDRAAWEGATSAWIAWITLRDFNSDGFRDIVALDKGRALIYLNDGQGNFTKKP
jgi:hypothetical protein